MNCYICDNENCFSQFAIDSFNDNFDPSCPNCGSEVTATDEVIVNPRIMSKGKVEREGII